ENQMVKTELAKKRLPLSQVKRFSSIEAEFPNYQAPMGMAKPCPCQNSRRIRVSTFRDLLPHKIHADEAFLPISTRLPGQLPNSRLLLISKVQTKHCSGPDQRSQKPP